MSDKSIKELNKATDLISSIIHDYLYKRNYLKTLEIFQQELSEKIKSGKYYSFLDNDNDNNKAQYDSNSLLNAFISGNKNQFMAQWKLIIPNNLKLTESSLFKLDFNIHIYFSIFPLLKPNSNINNPNTQKILKQNMNEFKIYLEQNNTEQFKTPEFLPYYALPYIPDPRKNPAYAPLFTPEWSKCLQEQIKRCLDYYTPNNGIKFPILYDLTKGKKIIRINDGISNNNANSNLNDDENEKTNEFYEEKIKELIKENKIMSEENNILRIKDEKNKKLFLDTQKNWCNLALDIISYSFDLISIYYKMTNNYKDNNIEEINNKLIKYQNFLVKNYEELEKSNNNSNNYTKKLELNDLAVSSQEKKNKNEELIKEKKTMANSNMKNNNNINISESINMKAINEKVNSLFNSYDKKYMDMKIKESLKKEREALKKNTYKNSLIDMKKFIEGLNHQIYIEDEKLAHIFKEISFRLYNKKNKELREFTLYEIFYYDLFGCLSKDSTLFKQLLSNKNLNLEVMKLVNGLANYIRGKNYLLSKNTLIEDIVKCMIAEKSDTELRQNCLGAIQKFTLRKNPQNKLIELNVIHYLVDIFTYQSNSLSDYSKEYGLALLMNLSLRKEGKEKFEAVGEKILKILINYLNYENIQILTCINGLLYLLLKKKKMREIAKAFEIEKKLEDLKNINDEQLKKQIKYILNELELDNNENNKENNYNNNDKEDEFVEEDIYEKDDIDNIINEYPQKLDLDEQHYKIVSEFIIPDKEVEFIERRNLIEFMSENTDMTKGLLNNNNSNKSNDSEEENINHTNNININNGDTNENKEDEDYINMDDNNENEENEGEKCDYGVINENNNDFDDIYGRPDDGFAFKTKDKIKRTPPRKYK